MPSITVLDSTSTTQTVQTLPAVGQTTASASLPVVVASDQSTLIVGGKVADGLTPINNAIHVAGIDGGGLKRTLLTDTTGRLIVEPAADAYAWLPASLTNYLPASAASNNLAQIKATAGAIKSIHGYNARTSAVYLKLFGLPSAGVTAGTTAAVKSIYLPASSAFALDFPAGYAPSGGTGLSYMLTTGGALADNTPVAANDILGLNVDYL